ncbi:hypothetical protein BJ741DRAFT_380178 [Chytriomyces cf. hyalinus JEL632]|nr:hypothetical protein BJ741DRAFT_380178 [Chytriomyces cf. hyalinus JEL632]
MDGWMDAKRETCLSRLFCQNKQIHSRPACVCAVLRMQTKPSSLISTQTATLTPSENTRARLALCTHLPDLNALDAFRKDGKRSTDILSQPSLFRLEWLRFQQSSFTARTGRDPVLTHHLEQHSRSSTNTTPNSNTHSTHPDADNDTHPAVSAQTSLLPIITQLSCDPPGCTDSKNPRFPPATTAVTTLPPPPPPPPPPPVQPLPLIQTTQQCHVPSQQHNNEIIEPLSRNSLLLEIKNFKSASLLRDRPTLSTNCGIQESVSEEPAAHLAEILKRRAVLAMSDESCSGTSSSSDSCDEWI